MKTQLSRNTFDVDHRYSGVYQQMGRMLTDADWNELSDLTKHRLADVLTDVIGSGTPRGRGIVEIIDNPDGTQSYNLHWGYGYVDGIIAQVRPDPAAILADPAGVTFEYDHQADFPNAPMPPPLDAHVLYLDVWERSVVTLEDPSLSDPGLHGADTCTRTQTMAQVKWCEPTLDPENPEQNPSIGNATLTLQLREASTEPDPCDPCADEIALQDKVGNYLFRVEVHHVEYAEEPGPPAAVLPQRVIIKWSSENGAEQYAIGDGPLGFESSDWVYEFHDGYFDQDVASPETFDTEKHLGRHLVTGFAPTRGNLTNGYPDTVPAGYTAVRRWDGYCEMEKSGGAWVLVHGADRGAVLATGSSSAAHGHVTEGGVVTINLDAITLGIGLDNFQLLAGDFWYSVIRQAINVAGDVLLDAEEPRGILHHYMTLGTMSGGVFTAYQGDQCQRFEFPPLTDIHASDVCYDNTACDMAGVETVQGAIDYLCRERDLRWHNKHLHGWGIVCGLIAECGLDTLLEADGDQSEETQRRQVRITSGYALTSEGEDVVLEQDQIIDVMGQIESLEEQDVKVLTEGNGTVCLRLDLGADGMPSVTVEPYDANTHSDKGLLDGTLLMDFYQECLVDLQEAILGELQFLNQDETDELEGGRTGLVSDNRRKYTSVLNLIIQLANYENGAYVFLSQTEHCVLKAVYLALQDKLKSQTFCGMYEGDEFPDYPFRDTGMTTYFGKNSHTRAKVHPTGQRVYTYGGSGKGTGRTINVYDVEKGGLVEVIEMPAVDGAEVVAMAFSQDGSRLYAAAVVGGTDTILGTARIGNNLNITWESETILCGIEITEMETGESDSRLVYAVGRGQGLYFLRPDALRDEANPRPEPVYSFNAVGHMVIDFQGQQAYCTEQQLTDNTAGPTQYDSIAFCSIGPNAPGGTNQEPTSRLSLNSVGSNALIKGTDGLALRPPGQDRRGGALFVVVNGPTPTSEKLLLTYSLSSNELVASLSIENTQVSLAFHAGVDRLILAMEDSYRLQLVEPAGKETIVFRVPVQIQPVDVVVDPKSGNVYTLNYVSNTISVVPAEELEVDSAFLDDLAAYRLAVLMAFYGLVTGLLQYIKDCFCHHLLVKCPESSENDILYLATVEIRGNEVFQICNFDKRKTVKSFPTMGYWFSLIPVWPILKYAVSMFCCSILPDFLGKYQGNVIRTPASNAGNNQAASNSFKASTARDSMRSYQRLDIGTIIQDQLKSIRLLGNLAGGSMMNTATARQPANAGVRKQYLMQSSVNEATTELTRNNIEVVAVNEYKPEQGVENAASYIRTPERVPPGSRVTLYQRDGRVMFYALARESPPIAVEVPEDVKVELAQFEERKASLSDFTNVNSELARVETRLAGVAELDGLKQEIGNLQVERLLAQEELAAMRSQIDSIRAERVAEEQRLTQIDSQRTALSTSITELNQGMRDLANLQRQMRIDIAKSMPVIEIPEVSQATNRQLQTLGIRTVEDLAAATPEHLTQNSRISATTAIRIISAAKARLAP